MPFDFEILHGQLAPNLAHVYARVASLPGGQRWKLSGRIRGPECLFAKTLPATVAIVDAGEGPTLLAKATLPEPCFWNSELPFVYRVIVEIREAGNLIATHEQLFGLRFLGPRQRYFYWANQRWVLRGVSQSSVVDAPLASWRELATAMVVEDPDDELCQEASRQGVVLVATLRAASDPVATVHRLAQWPAVAMVLFDSDPARGDELQKLAPNLALGLSSKGLLFNSKDWPQVALVDASSLAEVIQQTASRPIPLIVRRQLQKRISLAEARLACDELQRDVVIHGDFAGYVV